MKNLSHTNGNNYDISMSNHRRIPWGRAIFCGGYYLLMDRPQKAGLILES